MMSIRGFARNFKPVEILTEEQVEAIHLGTLNILERSGIKLEHKQALKLLERNGCKVNYDEMRVRIPAGLVEECLRKAPSSYYVKAGEPGNDLQIGGNTLWFFAGCGMGILDLDTQKVRPATKKERDDGCVILDALDNVHYYGSYTPYFEVEGIPPVMAIPEAFAAVVRNSTKVQFSGYQLDCEVFNIEMAKVAGKEVVQNFVMAAPMTARGDAVEAMFRGIEAGLPLHIGGGATMGATAPSTLAGALILHNAQNIGGIVLAQTIRPGTRVLTSDFALSQDMRSGSPAFGNIGGVLHLSAFNQIWRRYGIPVSVSSPGYTSSKMIDFQCSYEKALGALAAALSGSNAILFHGSVYGEISWHPAQAMLDSDIVSMIGRYVEGIEVTDESLAVDLMNEVGPIPGMYLDKAHTRKWWKREQFMPTVADSDTYPEWIAKGRKTALDHANERVAEILATHKPKPLTPNQEEEIEKILQEARTYYRKKGLDLAL